MPIASVQITASLLAMYYLNFTLVLFVARRDPDPKFKWFNCFQQLAYITLCLTGRYRQYWTPPTISPGPINMAPI